MNIRTKLVALFLAVLPLAACATHPAADTASRTIYEVNIRQYSPEGTIDAFRAHIPRLQRMNVGILWLMPIHPIGKLNRKETLGSYYAATDYKAVNPEFGSDQDMRELVSDAHAAGMLVILDWVPNHTAWDHVWTRTHPERYTKAEDGGFTPPIPDWDDVIDLNYDEPSTRTAMIDAMRYWVTEFDIDGFRCDVAELVPADFWSDVIAALNAERPVFVLAEGHAPWLFDAGFNAAYDWGVGDILLNIKAGKETAQRLREHVVRDQRGLAAHGDNAFRMLFTSNHDWNSWNGIAVQRMGEALDTATVLTFTLPGMPLIYSGQEGGLNKQLEFFNKDQIDWPANTDTHPASKLYTKLARLKQTNPALRHGQDPGSIEFFDVPNPDQILAFRRAHGNDEIITIANLSDTPAPITNIPLSAATYTDLEGNLAPLPAQIEPWAYRILIRK